MTGRAKSIVITGCLLIALVATAQLAGIRINTTHSYPPGLYIKTHDPIEKGAMVIFCPPDTKAFQEARARGYIGSGFCPGGYEYMIKKILAASGDRVVISAEGVAVNRVLLPNSKPMVADADGRALPHLSIMRALGKDEVLLMSDYSAKSFDARYFGALDKSIVISALDPMWIW